MGTICRNSFVVGTDKMRALVSPCLFKYSHQQTVKSLVIHNVINIYYSYTDCTSQQVVYKIITILQQLYLYAWLSHDVDSQVLCCSPEVPILNLSLVVYKLAGRFKFYPFYFSMMAVTSGAVNYNGASIREVTDDVMVHGEGPFWDSENNVLYFVDISQQRVYRFYENRLEHVQLGRLFIRYVLMLLFRVKFV